MLKKKITLLLLIGLAAGSVNAQVIDHIPCPSLKDIANHLLPLPWHFINTPLSNQSIDHIKLEDVQLVQTKTGDALDCLYNYHTSDGNHQVALELESTNILVPYFRNNWRSLPPGTYDCSHENAGVTPRECTVLIVHTHKS